MPDFWIPGVTRRRRKEAVPEVVEFVPVRKVFKRQRRVLMYKDVTGWVNNDKTTGKKWHLNAGKDYFFDDEVADSFIIKGYGKGELSRVYSDDERASIRATMTNISLSPEEIGAISG